MSYFPMPGRAECIRIALVVGDVQNWEDRRLTYNDWLSIKPSSPWGSMPILELADGSSMGQSRSILRFVGKVIGLYPSGDVLSETRVDELMDSVDDAFTLVNKTGMGLEQSAKEAARAALFLPEAEGTAAGATLQHLSKIDAFIGAHGRGGFAVGGSLTVADLYIATQLAIITSGFLDGVPLNALDGFPRIQAVRASVMTHPTVAAWYASRCASGQMGGLEKALCSIKGATLLDLPLETKGSAAAKMMKAWQVADKAAYAEVCSSCLELEIPNLNLAFKGLDNCWKLRETRPEGYHLDDHLVENTREPEQTGSGGATPGNILLAVQRSVNSVTGKVTRIGDCTFTFGADGKVTKLVQVNRDLPPEPPK